ncbi:ESX secretion-associated protein EspG [Nocardia sp. BSTN01]|uniref:ESX secretion-associated protein EspG n=1 Tax=Nocardia sp. BSTN01 TaxID=2783665 RepID=UPI00188DE8AE|nr:ESX secretion-associated protein EspG [Nocardia sp. BSTN01]MBF4999773.1 ESX secretion-associated protein EspG [Nocardia sp. BSTN01]
MTEWTWEPDDFAALWLGDANDRIPGLLRFTSRFAFRDEFEAHRSTVRQRYGVDEFERIQLALHTLNTSDMRIEIFGGTTKYKGSDGTQRVYRIIGARNLYHAAVLHQFTQGDVDGRIRLRLCRTDTFTAQLAATIPPCEPGTKAPITVHPADLRDGRNGLTRNTPRERYLTMINGPVGGGGSATLHVGAFNADVQPSNAVQWYDIPDGRYIETRGEHITVRPVDAGDLGVRFNFWIDCALQRLREDEPAW